MSLGEITQIYCLFTQFYNCKCGHFEVLMVVKFLALELIIRAVVSINEQIVVKCLAHELVMKAVVNNKMLLTNFFI